MSAFVRISRIHRVMKREKRQDAFVRLLQGLEWVSRKRLIPPWQSQAFCISFILSSAILLPLAIKHGDLLTSTWAGTRAHKKSTFWASRALIYRFEDAGAGSSTYDLIRTCLLNAGRMHVPRDMDGTHVHTDACTNVSCICV